MGIIPAPTLPLHVFLYNILTLPRSPLTSQGVVLKSITRDITGVITLRVTCLPPPQSWVLPGQGVYLCPHSLSNRVTDTRKGPAKVLGLALRECGPGGAACLKMSTPGLGVDLCADSGFWQNASESGRMFKLPVLDSPPILVGETSFNLIILKY